MAHKAQSQRKASTTNAGPPRQQRILAVDETGFAMGTEPEESKQSLSIDRYITTGILSAGGTAPRNVTTSRLTDRQISENEALLALPASKQASAALILDPSTAYRRLVRPEQDLLHFTADDIAAAADAFWRARERLGAIGAAGFLADPHASW